MMGGSVAQEDIRFAVVLNGGVSLAIWMGGVVVELDRLTRQAGPYRALLRMLGSTARVDVISGTSAGGINGAALALAQANEYADLTCLRQMWAEQGRMESLLRAPFQGSPPSLLKGDDHFLPQLAAAMQQLVRPFKARGTATDRPIDLTIRATLLRGAKRITVDALGQRLPQTLHEGAFHFVREPPETHVGPGAPRNDFDEDDIEMTAARLALASRSTASFPVAFEPSFVPVRGGAGAEPLRSGGDPLRPDMAGVVNWSDAGLAGGSPGDGSRFAVDGGLLANTPTRDALVGIGKMPGGRPVRRVVLLVHPHAPTDTEDPPDTPDGMPTLTATTAGLLGALSSQGSRTFVDEVEQHNRQASGHRDERSDILAQVDGSPTRLRRLAEELLPHFRILRRRRAGRRLAQAVPKTDGWSFERICEAAATAQDAWIDESRRVGREPQLPYVGDSLPDEGYLPTQWEWGSGGADDVLSAVSDLLKRLSEVVSPTDAETLVECRKAAHRVRTATRDCFDQLDQWWLDERLSDIPPDVSYWTLRLIAFERTVLGRSGEHSHAEHLAHVLEHVPAQRREAAAAAIDDIFNQEVGRLGRQVVDEVMAGIETVHRVLDILDEPAVARLGGLQHWQALLPPGTARETILARLLWLEVVTSSLGDEAPRESDYPVELVQLSLQTANPFTRYTKTADDKVGGMAIMRFSGFLKRSWRLNDWAWGRIDAATTLCQILLKPGRLRRVAELDGTLTDGRTPHARATEMVDRLGREIFGTDHPDALVEGMRDLRDRAIAELEPVYEQRLPADGLPTMLPTLAAFAAWGLHVRIAADELPQIAAGVRADQLEGANTRSRGSFFLVENGQLLDRLQQLPPAPDDEPPAADPLLADRLQLGEQALSAFDRAGIGREPLREEGTSDQMIRTVSTAVGVAVTVADGDRSGLGAAKKVTRALRGGALLPYWAVNGLTGGGTTARFFALLGLAFGGILVTLALFGLLPEWAAGPGAALGIGTLLGMFGYGALRTGSLLHGVVLLSPIIPLAAYAFSAAQQTTDNASSAAQGVAVVAVVLALVLGLIVLGSLPAPMAPPLASLSTTGLLLLKIAGVVAALAVLAGVIAVLVRAAPQLIARVEDNWVAASLVALAAVVVGVVTSYLAGRSFRLWRRMPAGSGSVSAGSRLFAAGRKNHRGWCDLPVTHPAASAAGWAVVYGVAYVILAGLLVRFAADDAGEVWVQAAFVTCLLFGGALLLVVPWAVPWFTRRGLRVRLLTELTRLPTIEHGQPVPRTLDNVNSVLRNRMEANGVTYRYLCVPSGTELQLLRPGRRIAETAYKRLAAPADTGGGRGDG